MKRIIITMLAAMCITAAFGQKTNVAVYVQGNASEEEKKVVSSRIISIIVKSDKYAAVERTADFLAEIRREQGYQYSGNVDDGQIIKLGKQFGVKTICVADVNKRSTQYQGNYAYSVAVRMIDIETGLVISAAGPYDEIIASGKMDLNNLIDVANNVGTNLLQNVTTTIDKQKIAIYVSKSGNSDKAKCVSSQLTENITNTGAFITVDRTSDFLAELKYQSSGNVDDRQLSRLGKQFGVNLVCVIDVTELGNYEKKTYTMARIIDVETGVIMATSEKEGWRHEYSNSYGGIFKRNLDEITSELMQQLVVCIKKDKKAVVKCCEGLINVDGVCRDRIWLKDYLGIEVNANDLEVRQGTILEGKCETCPEGWRLPTKAELEKMLTAKGALSLRTTRMYLTSDFTIKTYYDARSRPTSRDYYYYVWDASNFSQKRIYDQSYSKKGKASSPYYYGVKDLYVRCVKD